MAMVIV